jgi:hypothetical protein
MCDSTFHLDFHGRKSLTSNSKTYYYITGIIEIAVGIFGLIKSSDTLKTLSLILLIAGIANILIALIGKSLTKEKNFISISPDIIEFKNAFQKPKIVRLNNLLDIRIDSKKIEFVMTDHQVKTYDFSAFSDVEITRLYDEIGKLKSTLKSI